MPVLCQDRVTCAEPIRLREALRDLCSDARHDDDESLLVESISNLLDARRAGCDPIRVTPGHIALPERRTRPRTLDRSTSLAAGLRFLLDRMPRMALLVDERLQVIEANLAARETAGIPAIGERIELRLLPWLRVDDLERLAHAVREACRGPGVATVLRPTGTPGGLAVLVGSASEGIAALILSDTRPAPWIDGQFLRAHFDLSHAEAEIAQALAHGHDVAAIARDRRAARETVRSQIKSLFAKLAVRSQAQAVSVIMRSLATLRTDA